MAQNFPHRSKTKSGVTRWEGGQPPKRGGVSERNISFWVRPFWSGGNKIGGQISGRNFQGGLLKVFSNILGSVVGREKNRLSEEKSD